ncbi:MAG: hypothetical protein AAF490_01085 [Chloroflexota bacterium]
MILNLEMPYYDRMVEQGTIITWHKQEGEFVNFGDDLFDVRIDEITKLKRVKQGQAHTTDMVKGKKKGIEFTLRITSSDMGYLRKIDAAIGDVREVGQLVAIMTTTADETMTEINESAPAFRVVSNVTENE